MSESDAATILGGLRVGAGVASAESSRNIAEAQAEQAEINARQIAAANELTLRRELQRGRAREGALRARIGSSGVASASGSAVSLIADEIFETQLAEAIVLARGGQAVTRQRNIGRSIRARGRSRFISESINAVGSGLELGAEIGSIL